MVSIPGQSHLFLGDSNLNRLPKMEAWDVEVHSFPGASIVDAYAVLKHRTKGSEVTEHVILSFGLNDRNKGNITVLGRMLEKLI